MDSDASKDKKELKEPIPDEVRAAMDGIVGSDEEIHLSVSTDMGLDGEYGTGWLLATDKRLLAFSPNGADPFSLVHIRLTDIASVEMRDLFSNNILKVRTADRGAEVARFSKSLAYKFAQVTPEIEELLRRSRPEEIAASDDDVGRGRGAFERQRQRCPNCGKVKLPRWGGVCPFCIKKGKLLFRLLSYGLPYWKVSLAGLTLMLTATFISLTPPLLTRTLIDDVLNVKPGEEQPLDLGPEGGIIGRTEQFTPRGSTTLLAVLVTLLFAITVSTNALRALRSYMMEWLGQRVTFDLRNQVYRHLHTLSLSFFSQRETGRIMSRITNDVGRLQDFISEGLQEMIRSVLTLVIICGILFSLNWQLATFVLLPTPFLVIVTIFFGRRLHKVFRILWKRFASISAILSDTIPGIRVVKAFAQEEREVGKFMGKSEELLDGSMRAAKLRTSFMPIMGFITSLGTIIIWWAGGHKVIGGTITLGDFVAFSAYMWQFYGPVESLCRLNHRLQSAATAAERVFDVLDSEPDMADDEDSVQIPEIEGHIEFQDVTFSYEEEMPVLKAISFDVKPGEMIGLAGHSGAGKSTLINLICRFYDVDSGRILVDGYDVREVKLKSLRDQIGVVLQEPFLFNGTVEENIVYGKPGASMREIMGAAKAANAHDFIVEYPDGYDTQVGERGSNVSGGERQRLAIARAILKDPRILILDEATSNVDTETEAQIQEALARLIEGRTTFAIAHRLSTLKHSNRLLIIEKGRVAEMGTHDELIEQDGIYARLCNMQTELSKITAL